MITCFILAFGFPTFLQQPYNNILYIRVSNRYFWKVMGLTPVDGSENCFCEYFDLRTLFHYLCFRILIQILKDLKWGAAKSSYFLAKSSISNSSKLTLHTSDF